MQGMSPQVGVPEWNPVEEAQAQANLQGKRTGNETALLTLFDLKQKQASEQEVMAAIQKDPRIAQLLFGGGSTIGSLGGAGAPGGPPQPSLTQQTLTPGQPPGAPQTVPGGQDLSQFATQGAPTQSTIGSLGPAGQPQMQGAQNPALEMARTNPRAAMMMQQQIQGQQDAQMKRQEQNLKLGAATLGYVGQQAQGVTDQASLDALRSDLQSQGLGKYAAQLPQLYSKEAMQPFIAKALDVKESLTLQVQDLTAQAAVIRARKEGRATDVDNELRGMGVQPGQETPAQMKEALQLAEDRKSRVSASHGTGQIVMTPAGAVRVGKDNQVEIIKGPDGQPIYDKPTAAAESAASYGDRARRAHDNAVALEEKGLTPSLWTKVGEALPLGLGNYLVGEDQRSYRQAVNQFGSALLRKESGAAISQTEYDMVDRTFFPQPNDSKKQIEAKRREREAIIKNLQEEGKGAGRTGTQAQPASQGSTGTGGQAGGKVVTRAALQAENARRNEANRAAGRPELSDEQAEAMAKQKGYEVR